VERERKLDVLLLLSNQLAVSEDILYSRTPFEAATRMAIVFWQSKLDRLKSIEVRCDDEELRIYTVIYDQKMLFVLE